MILVGQMVWSECENGLVAEIDDDRRVVLYDNNGGFWMELHNGTVVTRVALSNEAAEALSVLLSIKLGHSIVEVAQ